MDQMMQQPAQPAGEQGYVIEISVLPDGTFNVSKEPLQEEANEPGEEPGEEFSTLGEVLQAVMRIIKSSPMTGDADAQFDAGFNGRR